MHKISHHVISVCWCHVSVLFSVLQVLVIRFQIAAFLILENYILEFIGHFVCYLRKQQGNSIALISAVICIWCSSRFWNYQRKFFSHGEALIYWGSHQTTALVVCKDILFSTVDLLGGTDKPTCTKCSKWLDKNFLNNFEKCKNNNTSTKFSCAPAQVAID